MNQNNFRVALEFLSQISDDRKVFRNLNLAGTTLEKFKSPQGCSFIEMNFQECRMPLSVIIACRLKNSLFDQANLMGSIIAGSDCEGSSFQQANLTRANFFKSRLLNAIFRNANIKGVNFKETNLRGADLRGTLLEQASFEGAIFDNQTQFDPGVKPEEFGLQYFDTTQEENEIDLDLDETYRPSMRYRGAIVAKESKATKVSKKDVKYRGASVAEEQDPAPTAKAPAEKPPMFYRGVRIN